MPSLRARAMKWVISWKFSDGRSRSPEDSWEKVFEEFEAEDQVDQPPASITGDAQFVLEEERYKLEAGQEWVVHHLKLASDSEGQAMQGVGAGSGQVVLYWHGGAFIHKMTAHHWEFIRSVQLATGASFIIPHYTMAPLCTASQSVLASISLILQIASDPRYTDKEIVLMGDSAGGWFVARLLLALTELALEEFGQGQGQGDKAAQLFDIEKVRSVRRRIKKAVTISGAFDMDLAASTHKEDELLQADDPWLNMVNLRLITRLWSYGPTSTATPEMISRLPPSCPALTCADLIPPTTMPLTDKSVTPTNGVDVLQRYAKRYRDEPAVQIIQTIGSADILYNQNVRLHAALKDLGEGVVRSTMISEPGLFHVYPLIQFLPESQRAIQAFVELLNQD